MTSENGSPVPSEIFTAIKSSCRRCRQRAGITIDSQAVNTFLTHLSDQQDRLNQLRLGHGTKVGIPKILTDH